MNVRKHVIAMPKFYSNITCACLDKLTVLSTFQIKATKKLFRATLMKFPPPASSRVKNELFKYMKNKYNY